MSSYETRSALLTRHIRTLRGGSQPILAEASDGNLYVVKFAPNRQGPNLLFNESIGTELYRAAGLPVAPWKILQVTDSFLDKNPACWFETREGRHRPAPGLCFGSLFMASKGFRVFEILPGDWFKRVKGAGDFWLAWFLDVCAKHADRRQAIFFQGLGGQFRPIFIDFGHMFAGPTASDPFRDARAFRYMDPRVYPTLDKKLLLKIRKIVDTLDIAALWRRVADLPEDWKSKSALQSFGSCLDKMSKSQFLDKTLEAMVKFHQRITCEDLRQSRGQRLEDSVLSTRVQPCTCHQRSIA